MAGVTLDAGGLIALDRDDRRMVVLLARARETAIRPASGPTGLIAGSSRLTARSAVPDRQSRTQRVRHRQPTTDVIDLGRVDATNVGRLLAASGTSDIADAHVVICARRTDQPVITSDPGDLGQPASSPSDPAPAPLDPALRLIAL